MRKRLTSETLTPGSAYATDEQVQAALNITQQPLGQDPSIHPTATVSKPIKGVAWAQEEQAVRAALPVHPRPTTFTCNGKKIPID